MKPILWKSKRSDVFIVIALLILAIIGFHLLISLSGSRHHRVDSFDKFMENLSSPGRFIMAIAATLLGYSPFYAFQFKVPKKITFDPEKGLLIIQRRHKNKPQLIALEGIGYVYYQRSFFSILEIYHNFETPRGTYRKRFRTIMVPFRGMSITRKDLLELVEHLKESGASEEPDVQRRNFSELVGD